MNRPEFRRIPRPSCPLFVNLFGETITLSACSEETTIRSAAIEVEKLWGRHRAKKLTEVLTMVIRPTSAFRRVDKETKATFRADSRPEDRGSDERSVGKEVVGTCRIQWSRSNEKQKK